MPVGGAEPKVAPSDLLPGFAPGTELPGDLEAGRGRLEEIWIGCLRGRAARHRLPRYSGNSGWNLGERHRKMPLGKMAALLLHHRCLEHRQVPAIDFIDPNAMPTS